MCCHRIPVTCHHGGHCCSPVSSGPSHPNIESHFWSYTRPGGHPGKAQLLPLTLDGHFQHAHGLRTLRLSTPLPNCPVNVDLAFICFAQVSSAHLKQRAAFPIKGIKSYKSGVIYIMHHLMLKQLEDIRVWSGYLPAFALLRLLKVSLSSFHITSYKNFIKHSLLQAHPPFSVMRLLSVKGSCKLAWVSSSARTHTSVFMGKLKTTILALDISSTTVHTDLCYYFFLAIYFYWDFPWKPALPKHMNLLNYTPCSCSGVPPESGLQDSASI